jgi:hypothetical protein
MIRALQFPDTGRVVVPADHPLAKALRPSAETIAKITRQEHENALGWLKLRDTILAAPVLTPLPNKRLG